MSQAPHERAARVTTLALLSSAAFAACTIGPPVESKPRSGAPTTEHRTPPYIENCHPYLMDAMAALATPQDTTPGAIPGSFVHATKMHEYHSCLSRNAAAQSATPP
jgi:hypothetical protein